MGASESREGNLNDSDTEEEEDEGQDRISHASDESFHSAEGGSTIPGDLNLKMGGLSLRASASRPAQSSQFSQRAKLYHYIKSGTPQAKWILADKAAPWEFAREDGEEEDGDYEEGSDYRAEKKGYDSWVLQIGRRVKCRVDQRLQMRFFDEQMRVDFVFQGVWAMKFMNTEDFNDFKHEFQNCLFENIYFLEATEENKLKIFGKEFIGWLKPQEADEAIWEDAKENLEQPPVQELKESQVEPMEEGIRSLTLGALGNSFLVGDSKIEAYRNTPTGLQGKGISVRFKDKSPSSFISPKKAILMKGETNMMFMSPMKEGKPHAAGVHQLDIETGKIVTEWKFEKDGTPISMRDMTNDSKGAQLDSSLSTFLGLDDNRLCRWDMRDRRGNVQDLVSPVLNWADGHQFSRGTNFECFASTGDGGIVVGSKDGKVRLYGTTSMRQAKTAFPGLGSPITHVDVTYDGKWVLATTDTYMILISTVFIDKDGKMKNGFTGRMGNRIAAPRLLKLTPVDAHLAGKNQKFHAGHFSWVTESGKEERHLVVSVGNFTVIWDFSRVRQSNHKCYKSADGLKSCYCYKIVPKDESIVDSKFMHENFHTGRSPGAPLVVATPSKVSSFNI